MSDFETIPATPRHDKPEKKEEKPEEKVEAQVEKEIKEEAKPGIEVVDWENEPPAEEPVFATQLSSNADKKEAVEPEILEPVSGSDKPAAVEVEKKGNKKTWLIIVIAVVVLLCICCAIIVAGYFIYDSNFFGTLNSQFASALNLIA